jgi:hypothetical protein
MPYGFFITTPGWELLTALLAGETLQITKVMVGSGEIAEGANPETFTDLIHPEQLATSSPPEVNTVDEEGLPLENPVLSFVLHYDNYMTNGTHDPQGAGLQTGFFIREFGVWAKKASESGNGILLYYGTLGAAPQYVTPRSMGSMDIREYPVSIVLTNELEVTLSYPPGAFIMWQDLPKIVSMSELTTPPPGSRLHLFIKRDVTSSYPAFN